jgi:hypothetical protein
VTTPRVVHTAQPQRAPETVAPAQATPPVEVTAVPPAPEPAQTVSIAVTVPELPPLPQLPALPELPLP